MQLRRKKVDNSIEKRILTGLIVSSDYCREICPIMDVNYFMVDYVKTVAKWIQDFYFEYKHAPEKHIQNMFESRRANMSDAEESLIETFLSNLSKDYEEESNFNVGYLRDQTIDYFRERGLILTADNVKALVEINKLDKAENQMQNYKKISKETSTWVNPLVDFEYVERVLEAKEDVLFKFPGFLGEVCKGFQRDWLVGFLGPMKRGKSWWLIESATQAILNKLRTVFISLEMPDRAVSMRVYKRLMCMDTKETNFVYPVLDCERNQNGMCDREERTNFVKLLDESALMPRFEPGMDYKPCTACREQSHHNFVPTVWYDQKDRPKLTYNSLTKNLKAYHRMAIDKYLRIKAYPSYSANLADVKRSLDSLEYIEGFIPDVIVIDYADILAPEYKSVDRRSQIDETWKMLKNIAATRHCLVISASQSNRQSITKASVSQIDTAEDIRKLAHVDMMISLNQTKEEKKQKVIRVGVIAEREDEYNEDIQAMVLQQLKFGQTYLDSCKVNRKEKARK